MDARPRFHGRPPNTGFCFCSSGLLVKKDTPNLRADFTDPDRCGLLVLNCYARQWNQSVWQLAMGTPSRLWLYALIFWSLPVLLSIYFLSYFGCEAVSRAFIVRHISEDNCLLYERSIDNMYDNHGKLAATLMALSVIWGLERQVYSNFYYSFCFGNYRQDRFRVLSACR